MPVVAKSKVWKPGRGKLGFLKPLLGRWVAEADSPMGPLCCRRTFETVLKGTYVRLDARWEFGGASAVAPKVYEETAYIGAGDGGGVAFWSFTSDGKHSQGVVADVTDFHPEAIGFEAQMPAGLARMAYRPADGDGGGYVWVVESKNAKGWNRFVEHHYRPA